MTALPLVRVRLKHPDADTFVERFAPNVTRGGIFLASREPRPVGSLIRFEVVLMNGAVALSGEGRVTWVKPFNPLEPTRAHGMGVQFTLIDPPVRALLDRLLERREGAARPAAEAVQARPAPVRTPARVPVRTPVRIPEPVTTEFDTVEDTMLRRMMDRARVLAGRTPDLEDLLTPEAETPASLEQALAEFPRYLQRRGSGLHRIPTEIAAEPSGENAHPAPVEATRKSSAELDIVVTIDAPDEASDAESAASASVSSNAMADQRPGFAWSPVSHPAEGQPDEQTHPAVPRNEE